MRLEKLPMGIAATAEIAGIAETADFANFGDYCPTLPGVPILPSLQAENERLHAEIEQVARGESRDCKYWPEFRP